MRATDEALKRMDIARRVAQAYAKLDGIDSLAVGGSTARGNADEFSDVEIVMTYSTLPAEKDRKRILDELDESGRPVLMRDLEGGAKLAESLIISGVLVGLLPGTNDMLLSACTDLEKDLGEPSEIGVADLHDCVVIYDPKGLYDVVKRRLADYPVGIGTKVIQRKLRDVVRTCALDIPRAFRNQNWMQLLESRSVAQEALLRIAFVLNRNYFPRVKDAEWLLGSMVHLPENFADRMSEYAREHDTRKARKLLIELAKDLAAVAVEIWPETLEEKMIVSLRRLPEDLIPVLDYD